MGETAAQGIGPRGSGGLETGIMSGIQVGATGAMAAAWPPSGAGEGMTLHLPSRVARLFPC